MSMGLCVLMVNNSFEIYFLHKKKRNFTLGWRGGWQLLDLYTPHEWWFIFTTVAVSVVSLVLFKALRNISAVPFVCVIDESKEYFNVPTMFNKRVLAFHIKKNIKNLESSKT